MEAEDLTHPLPSTHGNSATYTKPTNLSLYSYHTHFMGVVKVKQGQTGSLRTEAEWQHYMHHTARVKENVSVIV